MGRPRKVLGGGVQVTVPAWPQDFREIWENVIVRTRHRVLINYVFYLLKLIDYRIPKLPYKLVACNVFIFFSANISLIYVFV